MFDDLAVTRLANEYDFDRLQLYRVYEHVGCNNLLGCLLNLCSSAPNPHESLDFLVVQLNEHGVDRSRLEEYFSYQQSQELIYEEPENLLDCDGEVDDSYNLRRIEWFNQASGYED